jgi:hypothetical protein
MEMGQRFLRDRVNSHGTGFAIGHGVEFAASILSDKAEARFAFRYRAQSCTEKTLHLAF